MSSSPTDQIRACRSLQELEQLWKVNIKAWSQMPADQAKEMIRVKDKCKALLLFQSDVDAAVAWLNDLWSREGLTMDDIPQERRDRALELDALMTQRANAGNYKTAKDALEQWRVCWTAKEEATGGC